MTALLAVCIKEEHISLFGRRLRVRNSFEAFNTIRRQGTTVYKFVMRIQKFKIRRTNESHEDGARLPSTSSTDENIQQAPEMLIVNWLFSKRDAENIID